MSEGSTMAAPTKSDATGKSGAKAAPAAASKKASSAASPVAIQRKTVPPQPATAIDAVPPAPTEPAAPAVVTSPEAAEPAIMAALPTAPVIKKDQEIMEETVNATTAKAQTVFADVNERTKSAMEKSSKMFEDMNDFAKGNVEAIVESSKIAAKGFETIGQDAAEYSRKSFEGATAAMKQFASVKSPTELFKLQSDYMRSAFDSLVAETSKNTEAMLKLAGDVAQPLSNRASVAAEKIKIAA
jgi:phasin family protein